MARALLVVALVVLAGCSLPTGGETATPERVTAAPVPEATARPGVLAPGVTDAGVTNPGRLAAAHARTLEATSYTVNQTLVQRWTNGTLRSRYATVARFGAEPGRFDARLVQTDREDGRLVTRQVRRYGDGERAYIATTEANRTTYRLLRYPDGEPRDPTDVYLRNLTNVLAVERVFTLVPTDTVGTFTENDTRFARVESTAPTTILPLRNVTVTATVAESGVIRSYRVRYDATREGELRASVALRYTAVGTTTVTDPPWLDRVNATATAG
jgi:hypothetical protein